MARGRRDFGADPGIVGQTVAVNNVPLTIVGVADAAFHGTIVSWDVEVFLPVMMAPQLGFTFGSLKTTPSEVLADRRAAVFYPQGFVRPGTSHAAAAAQGTRSGPRSRPNDRPTRPGSASGSSTSGRRRAADRPTCCRHCSCWSRWGCSCS